MPDPRDTPAMRQYYRFKRLHPECVLFFRIGDFYEMFDDDAVKVSRALGLTLTQRTEGVPMCGVPYHQLENYLRKALEHGFRVAVCEQVQEAAEAKPGSIIERGVTRVLTPGTLVDDTLLAADSPSTLAAVCFLESGDDSGAACAAVDLSTGTFEVFEVPGGGRAGASLADEFTRRRVTELLYVQTADGKPPARVQSVLDALTLSGTGQPSWHFRQDEAREALLKHFSVSTLEGFGLNADDPLVRPAGAIIRYLEATQLPESAAGADGQTRRTLRHLRPPRRENTDRYCTLDGTTLRSLEVLRTIRAPSGTPGDESDGSLIGVFAASRTFAGCRTPMGRRLLREWLCRPLRDRAAIEGRQRCVGVLVDDRAMAAGLAAAMGGVQDIARISARLALGRATPRDVVALGRSLAQVRPVSEATRGTPAFAATHASVLRLETVLGPLAERVTSTCVESPPPHLREGGLFRDGVDAELDEARRLQRDAAGWMAEYQSRLIAEHALPSLKVGFNKIFGYYIELPAAQSKRAPDAFSRKQTLKNAERYITPELKEFENKVTTAEARALARETALFESLCADASAVIGAIAEFGDAVAELDVLSCFADKSQSRRWTCPEIVDDPALFVEQGRHPVLDERLGSNFVPNDLMLGSTKGGPAPHLRITTEAPSPSFPSLALITGPNMAGKSTYIRTAALLTLLAHTGCFVPADRAVVGVTDRIFTRIGADDALHSGQSTFMVEMTETARILNHATPQSLIILDEIGRGTSTLDGLSLAWAIAESLANSRESGIGNRSSNPTPDSPRTLFATHYHELTDLEDRLPGRVQNLHVTVREWGEEIVFLHRILPGRTDQSYGIHVAKLAGLPSATIARAREILETLAVHHNAPNQAGARPQASHAGTATAPASGQLGLFTEYVHHPAVDSLREIKLEGLTPLQAFDALRQLKILTERR